MAQSVHASELLVEVEEFLKSTGMGAYYLGLMAAENPYVVARLRRGGDIQTKTAQKIREFMSERRKIHKPISTVGS